MRNNVKVTIILTIIYCMGIGYLTFFLGAINPSYKGFDAAETINNQNTLDSDNDEADFNNDILVSTTPVPTKAATATPSPSPTPTISPTPTPLPVYNMTSDGYPDIEKFFNDYYVAWNLCDYVLLEAVTTNPDNLVSSAILEKETQYIDDIRDFKYYIIKSYEDDAYIVYVYYEIKYININTALPRLDKFYLITDNSGSFKIYNDAMDEPLKTYFDERDLDPAISMIIKMANDSYKAALEKSEDLRIYIEALYR